MRILEKYFSIYQSNIQQFLLGLRGLYASELSCHILISMKQNQIMALFNDLS